MTPKGRDRYELLADAARANPGAQFTTRFVLDLFRTFGVPMTTRSARNLLARAEADGIFTRFERPGLLCRVAA